MGIDELRALAKEADDRGDREGAEFLADKIIALQSEPQRPSGDGLLKQRQAALGVGALGGGTIFDEPFRAGIGRRFAEIGGAIGQTFSSQKESDRIARQLASEQEDIDRYSSPDDLAKYHSGKSSTQVAEVAGGFGAIPAIKTGTGIIGALGRSAYNAGIAGGATLLTQPGEVGESNLDRAAIPMMISGGGTLGLEAAMFLKSPVRSMIASGVERSRNQPIARKGAQMVDDMRVQGRSPLMTIAEETQDPTLLSHQRTALQSDRGQMMGTKFDNIQKLQQEKLLRDIGDANPEDIATKAGDVINWKVKRLFGIRKDNASKLYGEVQKAGSVTFGIGKTRVPTDNLKSLVDDLENSYPGSMKSLREANMFPKYGNVDEFIALEARLRAIKDKGGIIIPKNPNAFQGQDKFLAKQLHSSLLDDMQRASEAGVFPDNFNVKLKKAINQYRLDSDAIKSVQKTRIGSLVSGKAEPEKVAEAFKTMKPDELKTFLSMADEFDVPVRDSVTKYMVGTALDKAKDLTKSSPGARAFDRDTVLRLMGMSKEKSDLLLTNPETRKAFYNAIELMKRTNKVIVRGAGESVSQKAQAAGSIGGGLLGQHAASASVFAPREFFRSRTGAMMANAIFDPNGRKAVNALLLQRLDSREAAKNFAILSGYAKEAEESKK